MDSVQDYWAIRAMLDWQVELGADEAISDVPIDRYALPIESPATLRAVSAVAEPLVEPGPVAPIDPVAVATAAAAGATDLAALAAAQATFDHCALKKGARAAVFADGLPAARVMIIGEPPGREEDMAGRPFTGRAGLLLDRMLAAIGLDRAATDPARAVYLVPVLPWRTASDGALDPDDIAMMRPFLHRHIALANPGVIVLMGNGPCQALLDRAGITRIRGTWTEVLGRPALPMVPPEHLLRTPAAKREAWADLLSLQSRLRGLP